MSYAPTHDRSSLPGLSATDTLEDDAMRALRLIQAGRFAAALAVLTVAPTDKETAPELYLLLATAREGVGNWTGATQALLRYLECGYRGMQRVDGALAMRWIERIEPMLVARAA